MKINHAFDIYVTIMTKKFKKMIISLISSLLFPIQSRPWPILSQGIKIIHKNQRERSDIYVWLCFPTTRVSGHSSGLQGDFDHKGILDLPMTLASFPVQRYKTYSLFP